MKRLALALIVISSVATATAQVVWSGSQSVALGAGSYELSNWITYETASGAAFDVDFDGNDIVDLKLFYAPGPGTAVVAAAAVNGGAVGGFMYAYATAFAANAAIGPDIPFMGDWMGGSSPQIIGSPGFGGNFRGEDRYLGVSFLIEGATHYGWVEVEGSADGHTALVKGWAYESTANTSIVAGDVGASVPVPEAGSLGLCGGAVLALIAACRRLRRKAV